MNRFCTSNSDYCIKFSSKKIMENKIYDKDLNKYSLDGKTLLRFGGKTTVFKIPEGVEEIGHSAFFRCIKLTEVIIPDSVTRIGESAFEECKNLKSVIIPKSVKRIEYSAFAYCDSLSFVSIPETVEYIGDFAFDDCLSMPSPIYACGCFLYMPRKFNGEYTIPQGIRIIKCGAFSDCTELTGVRIPNSVEIINSFAFSNCENLSKIILPPNVKVEYCAFDNCPKLKKITSTAMSATPKYVLLKFEGVLNTLKYQKTLKEDNKELQDEFGPLFDPETVHNLRLIINSTGAKVYLITSLGLERFDKMVRLWSKRRMPGTLLTSKPELTESNFIVITDKPNKYQDYMPYILETHPYDGLTTGLAIEAIQRLNKLKHY